MTGKALLPMGIENFKEIRTAKYYYVDKTGLIQSLLEHFGKVKLFTRPRRFGKTLNMSMLKYFFETGSDSALFDGLEISKERELCDEYMGKFPVISITLKGATGMNFEEAKGLLRFIIGNEALRFQFLLQSDRLTAIERKRYEALVDMDKTGAFTMSDELLKNSLQILSQLLQKHYGQNVVILIDEYDVPLDKAYQSGYYDSMVELIRVLFGNAFKTNDSLKFAVLTGCLRISRESIFTGINNFSVYTVKDVQYNEYFGFTDEEVRQMLAYYDFMEKYDSIKEWYDGYHFNNLDIYCPWDVVSYCHALRMQPAMEPQNYWVNTSSNDIVRRFINKADAATKDEIEQLVNGGTIRKRIKQELTYRDLDSSIENLWSILFTTGYLTQCGQDADGMTGLVIPNREIRWIYEEQIQEWFREETRKDVRKLENLGRAFEENDTETIEKEFTSYLRKTISIRDTNTKKKMKENFYHGILLGLFAGMDGWKVRSNAESGEGYSDISVEVEDRDIGIIIELKYAEKASFDEGCREALRQIDDRNYEEALLDDGMKTIYRYGIACYKKRCKVVSG
ncbi:MAG: ATP-binding protein [Lachnospiraceae bacterium]|jgi:hypothetical protein|nr:AAA family ATPase [Lachnospiraceae bacterium]